MLHYMCLSQDSCYLRTLGNFHSFEYLFIFKGGLRIPFLIIYRPSKYCASFINDFSELLSVIAIDHDCFIIDGDFSIHVDNIKD